MTKLSNDEFSKKRLSIVILNWNGAELMKRFLPSVIQYSPEDLADIIVADNGSTDDSVAMLKEFFPTVKIIQLDKNYGFAEGYNLAIKQVDTRYTVLLNSDIEVTEGWLEAPLQAMDADHSIACVQPKILAERNRAYFEYAGAAGGFIDKYGYPFCRGRILHEVEKDCGQYDASIDILWASGACLFIRTAIYLKEGGLDATFFAHQEEVDMCWRLRSRGYRLVCTPNSVVYHVGGATLKVESPRKTYLNFRNNLLMIYKNHQEKTLRSVMRMRFCLDYLAAIKFLLTGHLANAKAVYLARRDYCRLKSAYKAVRDENLSKTTLHVIPETLDDGIIFLFYLKGKKYFSALSPSWRNKSR
ncbi:glycosyltransferase family 2 protein [Parabacteroides sp. PF5-9]|uniref:glycosyltransferase family 2 protein n=1 Tax=Parabacteroides sp. PF5-9 TaxID=1742404 RepID=UPI002475D7FC|nr:glycosyltransferase family 2 protein [Parabacteroides sp. PF5-9]MDH6358638.1 GT2 family glycosyltransferase [Parabacteroides sp. PF5-9]